MPSGLGGMFQKLIEKNPDLKAAFSDPVPGSTLQGVGSGEQLNFDATGGDPLQDLERTAANELSQARGGTESRVLDSITNIADRQGIEKRASEQRGLANQASDVAEGIFERRTRGLGLTDRQRAGARQSFSINRAVSEADAGTNARRGLNRDALAAFRSGGAFDDIALSQQLAGLSGLANAEGQRRINAANKKAAKKSEKNGLIGSVVGIAAGFLSSEHVKDKVEVDVSLLDKLKGLRIDKWKYHGVDTKHIGPYAEEFNEKFGVGALDDRIDLVSMLGVTLGSIKELNQKVEALA